jgi:hypothetical protein
MAAAANLRTLLSSAKRTRAIVEIWRRPIDKHRLNAAVVDHRNGLVLLNVLDDLILLNGFSVIRVADISALEPKPRYAWFYGHALKKRKVTPRVPRGISLSSLPELMASASRLFPLVTIHRERSRPGECEIGRSPSVNGSSLTMSTISPNAEWHSRPFRCRLSSVTKVDFGGRYEEALALVAGLQANNAIDSDNYSAPLRAPSIARHRGR